MRPTTAVLIPLLLCAAARAQVVAPDDQVVAPDELAALTPAVEKLIERIGFEELDQRLLRQGRIVSRTIAGSEDHEAAFAVAMMVPNPMGEVVELVRSGESFEVARHVMGFGRIREGATETAIKEFAFEPYQSTETSKLLRIEPGREFNLSPEEREQVQIAAKPFDFRGADVRPEAQAAMIEVYRRILVARFEAYREGGIAALAPYDRGGGKSSRPDRDLISAFGMTSLVEEVLPDFYRALLNYPQDGMDDIEHRFYWIKQRVDSRPAAALTHRMFQVKADYAIVAERIFYAGHGYNAQQSILVCLPVEAGTMVFYGSRTAADRVTDGKRDEGFVRGRDRLRSKVAEYFRLARKKLAEPHPKGS